MKLREKKYLLIATPFQMLIMLEMQKWDKY